MPEPVSNRPAKQPFTIDDYFKIKRFKELALSSDGEMIAYAVEWQSLEENKTLRRIYVSATAPGAEAELIEDIQDARDLAWIPGGHELAFLSGRSGVTQVFAYDLASQAIRQRTDSEHPVVKFGFAPDGQSLAFITQEASDGASSLYKQFRSGDTGVLIDSDSVSMHDFVNPDWPDLSARPSRNLWLAVAEKLPFQAKVPGNAEDFHWSFNAKKLSVTYIESNMSPALVDVFRSSIGILDSGDGDFRVLSSVVRRSSNGAIVGYVGGEWIPGKDSVLVRRITDTGTWASRRYPEWSMVDIPTTGRLEEAGQNWQEIGAYGLGTFVPRNEFQFYINAPVNAVRSLYVVQSSAIRQADIVRGVRGSVLLFRFGGDFKQAAFVIESLSRAPEVHIWREGRGIHQLTRLNKALAKAMLPKAKEVSWQSQDGTEVHGWLLNPVGRKHASQPWPLITFIHGGPGYPMTDEFAHYFRNWAYPFYVYALDGMAVFVPNYRGTMSYGRKFAEPSRIDREPVEDIVGGIQHLIEIGVADPKRLGISGHSHGAWLAPVVMTRANIFHAGSFAEGWGNQAVLYDLMPGAVNRLTHDIISDGGLYANPERYIELSPELHLGRAKTAVLFEAGAKSAALLMLGFPKAARTAGMPAELVVYPKTGHNITIPYLQKESAKRNLDWFRFWLKGEEDPDPTKFVQYKRWRKMRKESLRAGDHPETEITRVQ
ncbi:MAG: prolyl oligopeptidase family serine peptidase [Sphingomonadales bacterium]|nr:prolyl oligopeptidase family serine peptidase [Sphingomonadales bacterium]